MITPPGVQQVFEQVQQHGGLEPGWENKLDLTVEQIVDVQPWYVRTMIGFGSWLASLLIIVSILAGTGSYERGGVAIGLGLIFIIGATALRRASSHDFTIQMALAFCLAGQGLLLYGMSDRYLSFVSLLYVIVLLQVIMIFIYPDRILRFLSVMFGVQAIVLLLFKANAQEWLHGLVFGLLMAFLLLEKNSYALIERGWYERVAPVMYGLLIAALAVLMLSTIYILPELRVQMTFFPYPWVSAVLSGLLFVAVIADILRRQNASTQIVTASLVMSVIFVLASLQMPGLIVACLLILLGFDRSLKLVTTLGFSFLTIFLAAWFYGLEVTLLVKSASLVAAGAVLLLIRFGSRHGFSDNNEADHA